jgi:putative ABC transport system permease protein
MSEGDRFFRNLRVVGRLKPGVTLPQAQAELDAFYTRLREQYARFEEIGLRASVRGMQDDVVEHVRPSLVMVFGGVMFLLLLACANVASLLLVRARGLAGEMAVRAALGCGRGRLVRQVLLESLLLSLSGGLLGLILGYVGIGFFLDLQPPSALRLEAVSLNVPVLAFALALAVTVGLAFGLLPALRAGRIDLIGSLKSQVAGAGGGRRSGALKSLVVAEVALSLILLLGAALMTRSVMELQRSRPGFDRSGTLTLAVNLYGERYFPPGASIEFFRELERQISALPGVQSVGTISILPLSGREYYSGWGLGTEDDPQFTGVSAHNRIVSGDLFQALGTRLLAGRSFTQAELSEEGSTVMVGEGLARISWPGEDPIGKDIVVRWAGGTRLFQVVGVVEDVRFHDLRSDEASAIYFPMGSRPSWAQSLVVRTSSDPAMLAGPIREIIRDLDPGLAPHSIRTMEDLVWRSLASSRFVLALMVLFAGIAVVLASVGLYGVVSYILKQRTPEIGIRMAFGAEESRILRMMVGQGAVLALGGIAAGVLGALAVSRFVRSLLYGVTAVDAGTFVTASVGLAALALLACYAAARRATRIDPVMALRAE